MKQRCHFHSNRGACFVWNRHGRDWVRQKQLREEEQEIEDLLDVAREVPCCGSESVETNLVGWNTESSPAADGGSLTWHWRLRYHHEARSTKTGIEEDRVK